MATILPLEAEYIECFSYSGKNSMAKRKVYYLSCLKDLINLMFIFTF